MKELSDFIKSKVTIETADLNRILGAFSQMSLDKHDLILKTGQISKYYYFIKTGAMRFYYGEYEEQLTAWVILKNEFFAEISSLNPQIASRFNIEAIEKTELYCIHKDEMERLYQQIPAWQEFGRRIWENMSIRMIDRIISFQTKSAEQRYLEFMQDVELIKRIPVKHIASFLGITPNALSRATNERKRKRGDISSADF